MNFFEEIDRSLKTAAAPSRLQRFRGSLGFPAAILGQSFIDKKTDQRFMDAATEATGGDIGLAGDYANDIVGASLIDPVAAGKLRNASNELTGFRAGSSALLPTIAGGLRAGGPYGLFFGAGPLASQGISNWRTDNTLGALGDLPEDQRLNFWNRYNDPAQAAGLKAESPDMFSRLSKIDSRAQTADEIRGGVFDQWNGPRLGPVPLHMPSLQTAGAQAALSGTSGLLERMGIGTAAGALRGLASASPASGFNTIVPTPALLARGAGAGVATWASNKANSALGGVGAPAVTDPVTGSTQYDGDHPWWHDSARGFRSSLAGAVGGAPLGPVGAIGGAVVNPIREAWGDISEIGGHFKRRYFDEASEVTQNRMMEDGRAAWRAREAQAKFDVAAQKGLDDSRKFMQSFANYRTALGIGVGVPLAGFLLYKMFLQKKKPAARSAPEPEPA